MLQDWLVVDHAKHDIPSPGCIRCYELRNDPGPPSDGVITHKYRLVTRVGALFALEIARDRLVPAKHPDGRDWTEKERTDIRMEYEAKPFDNPLSEYESIDMGMLTQDTSSPIVEDRPDWPGLKAQGGVFAEA